MVSTMSAAELTRRHLRTDRKPDTIKGSLGTPFGVQRERLKKSFEQEF
jgi:hypothetical protein